MTSLQRTDLEIDTLAVSDVRGISEAGHKSCSTFDV